MISVYISLWTQVRQRCRRFDTQKCMCPYSCMLNNCKLVILMEFGKSIQIRYAGIQASWITTQHMDLEKFHRDGSAPRGQRIPGMKPKY